MPASPRPPESPRSAAAARGRRPRDAVDGAAAAAARGAQRIGLDRYADSRSGATHGSESSGSRKPIGESPGIRNMCSARTNQRPLSQRGRPSAVAAPQRQHVADDLARAPARTSRASRARSSSSSSFGLERIDVRRQPPLPPQVVPDVLVSRDDACCGVDAERVGQRRDEALRVRRRRARSRGRRRRSARRRSRSARRRAASSSRAPSAAAIRRDTTCPGRSAAGRRARTARCSRRSSSPASSRFVGPERRRCSTRRRPCRRSRRTSARRPSSAARRRVASSSSTRWPSASIALPLLVGVRLGDARRSRGSARTRHLVVELDFALVDARR